MPDQIKGLATKDTKPAEDKAAKAPEKDAEKAEADELDEIAKRNREAHLRAWPLEAADETR